MDWSNPGLIGGIAGSIIGTAGGIIGTWASIRNARTPDERRAMIRLSIIVWGMLIFLIGIPLWLTIAGIIPKWIYWIGFGLFYPLMIYVLAKSARSRNRHR